MVEGVNHPIAPGPHFAQAVDVKAMGVGVAREIEPLHRHTLAVVRRLQQLVHTLFVCVGRMICKKRVDIRGSGWQAGQIKRNAPQQSGLIGFGRRLQPLGFQASENEIVDGVLGPGFVLDLGNCGAPRRIKRPVGLPFRPLIDPFAEEFDLFGRQNPARRHWRHGPLPGTNPLIELAGRAVARHDEVVAAAIGKHILFRVEAQVPLAALFLGAMAGKAGVRKDGANVAIEVNRLFWRGGRRLACKDREKTKHHSSSRQPSADNRTEQETPPPIALRNRKIGYYLSFRLEMKLSSYR